MNFLRVLTLVGDSTISKDLLLALRVDLALAFDFALVFGSILAFGLTVVLATTSPKCIIITNHVRSLNRT
jgi:hypothetical protein